MEARKDEHRRAVDMKQTDARSVEAMFRGVDEKLELILDAQDARFRMLADKLDRFNRRLDAFERQAEPSPRGPAPVVDEDTSRGSYESTQEKRRRLNSHDAGRRAQEDVQETLRYIHERLTALETQTQALPDKVTPAIHRRLDTLETQVKMLPDKVDSLLRQMHGRWMDEASPLSMLSDPQRHHALFSRTEESISAMHRTLESLEQQSRNMPDRLTLAINGSKFMARAMSTAEETLGCIQSRLEAIDKSVNTLPDRLQRFTDEELIQQVQGSVEPHFQSFSERVRDEMKTNLSEMNRLLEQSFISVISRLESLDKQTLGAFQRLWEPLEAIPVLKRHMDALPDLWTQKFATSKTALERIVKDASTATQRQISAIKIPQPKPFPTIPTTDEYANAVLKHVSPLFGPIDTKVQGFPQALHLALEDNVSVVAMVVNDALAAMHRRLDNLETLPDNLKNALKEAVHQQVMDKMPTTPSIDKSSIDKLTKGPSDSPTCIKKDEKLAVPTTPSPPECPAPSIPPTTVAVDSHQNCAVASNPSTPAPQPPVASPPPKQARLADPSLQRTEGTNITTTRLRPLRKTTEALAKPKSTIALRKRRSSAKEVAIVEPVADPTPEESHRFTWSDGSKHNAPEDWVFPITNCRVLWDLWFFGDPTQHMGPFRHLTKDDIKHSYVLKTRGKAAAVIQKILDTAIEHGFANSVDAVNSMPRDACLVVFEKAFDVLVGHSPGSDKPDAHAPTLLPLNACNNMFTTVYTMLANLKRKRSDADEN